MNSSKISEMLSHCSIAVCHTDSDRPVIVLSVALDKVLADRPADCQMQTDMEPVARDMLADSMDYMGKFAEPADTLAAAVIHDQTLDSVERWANYSTVDLVAVDDLDCQISDSYRLDGH